MFIKLKETGDTIVEVLIALTVLMVIIGGGYSIATRSLNGVQVAKERSEATKLAEGQLEAINWKLQQTSDLITLNEESFIGIGGAKSATEWDGLSAPPSPHQGWREDSFCVVVEDDLAGHPGDKSIKGNPSTDAGCDQGSNKRYHIAITTDLKGLGYDTDINNDKKQLTYKVVVTWARSGGGQDQTVEVADRRVVQ